MKNRPLISVVIPAYNYAPYLSTAIDSVLDQTIENIEIVVVDDASTDETPKILEKYKELSNVRIIINKNNLGAVPNVNKAFSEANGDYLMLLGADDFQLPGCIEKLYSALKNNPTAGFAYGNYVLANDRNDIVSTIRHPGHLPCDLPAGRDDFPNLLIYDDYINLCATMFRSHIIQEYGVFDETLTIDKSPGRFFRATDWDMVLRLSLNNIKSTFVYSPLTAFRVHEGQASVGRNFDEEGISARETIVLLERYFTAATAPRLLGHEENLSILVESKLNNYINYSAQGKNDNPSEIINRYQLANSYIKNLRESTPITVLQDPQVSIILSLSDNTEDIFSSIDKLNLQSYKNLELIIINRGHMNLSNIQKAKTKKIKNFQVLNIPGASLFYSYNIGAKVSTGKLLYFYNQRSNLPEDFFETSVSVLSKPEYAAVQYAATETEPNEFTNFKSTIKNLLNIILPKSHLWHNKIPSIHSFIVRRTVFFRQNGFDEKIPLLPEIEFILSLEKTNSIYQINASNAIVPSITSTLFIDNLHAITDKNIEISLNQLAKKFASEKTNQS